MWTMHVRSRTAVTVTGRPWWEAAKGTSIIDSEDSGTWDGLLQTVKGATQSANAVARDDARKAGRTEEPKESLITVIVAGFVGGGLKIIEAHADGRAAFGITPHSYIGSLATIAYWPDAAVGRLRSKGKRDDEVHLRAVMESAVTEWGTIAIQNGTGGRINYWRITAEGIERLS